MSLNSRIRRLERTTEASAPANDCWQRREIMRKAFSAFTLDEVYLLRDVLVSEEQGQPLTPAQVTIKERFEAELKRVVDGETDGRQKV